VVTALSLLAVVAAVVGAAAIVVFLLWRDD
jgi:hypothetical protein